MSNEQHNEREAAINAVTWEQLNPDWLEDGDLTDRFAKSQFDTCPSCDSIENIRVVNSSGDDEMASVLCCNWQCNGDCPSEAIENWNRRAASIDRVEIVGVDRSAVLTMIQAAKEGNWAKFDSYARFGAEKTGNERFVKAVDRFLNGDYGAEVIAAMEKGK